ncbi:MAG: cytochrome c family protein [Phycisphaerales bacterium]|nr:cytochrome c family protein [Phycisphaerales bacterium]
MKLSRVVAVVALAGAFAYLVQDRGNQAVADDTSAVTTAVVTSAIGADEFEYVGSKKCKMCHIKEYKSWEDTPHAKTMDVLKPNEATEAKTKHNLDPAKDYTRDEKCLACHVVGFGKAGGYTVPPEGDEAAMKKLEPLAAVGCESCHGPGSGYLDLKKEIMKDKREYTFEELHAKGMIEPTAEVCMKCHTEDHPTYDPEDKFDFDKMKEKGVHEHTELKLKKG